MAEHRDEHLPLLLFIAKLLFAVTLLQRRFLMGVCLQYLPTVVS